MRRLLTAGVLLLGAGGLAGCAVFGGIGAALGTHAGAAVAGTTVGATVATYIADAKTVKVAADDIAAANKPIVQAICTIEPWKPHSPAAQADIKQFCANVPGDALSAFKGAILLFKALHAEDTAHASQVSAAPP